MARVVEAAKMRAVLFVEVNGEPYRVTLPSERMELLLPLASSLFDDGKLGLSPTTLFKFPPAAGAPVPARVGAEGWKRLAEALRDLGETDERIRDLAQRYGLGGDGVKACRYTSEPGGACWRKGKAVESCTCHDMTEEQFKAASAAHGSGVQEAPQAEPHDPLRQAAEQFVASCKDGDAADLIDYYEEIFTEALGAKTVGGGRQ